MEDDLRPSNAKLISFSSHLLDDNGHLEFSSAFYSESIVGILLNANRDVPERLTLKAFPYLSTGNGFAILSCERRDVF